MENEGTRGPDNGTGGHEEELSIGATKEAG